MTISCSCIWDSDLCRACINPSPLPISGVTTNSENQPKIELITVSSDEDEKKQVINWHTYIWYYTFKKKERALGRMDYARKTTKSLMKCIKEWGKTFLTPQKMFCWRGHAMLKTACKWFTDLVQINLFLGWTQNSQTYWQKVNQHLRAEVSVKDFNTTWTC